MGDLEIGYIPRWICLSYWAAYVCLFVLFTIMIRRRKIRYGDNLINSLFISTVLILFCIFYCLDTDFFNYFKILSHPEWFEGTGEIDESTLWLARQLGENNFILFRFFIWGTAVIIAYLTCIVCKVSRSYTIFFLLVLFFNVFCYGRVSLAISIFFYGLAIYLIKKSKIGKIIGVLLMLTSLIVHRSMGIPLACLAVTIFPFTRKTEISLSFIIVIIGGAFAYLVLSGGLFSQGSVMAGRISSYNEQIAEGEWSGANFVGIMMRALQYLLFYYIFLVLRSLVYKYRPDNELIMGMYKITWVLILFSTAFLIAMGYTPYFYRVMNITMLPLCIMLTYFMSRNQIKKKQYYAIMGLAFFFHNLNFYSIYINCI